MKCTKINWTNMGIPHSKVAKLISVPFHVIERQRNHERKETVGSKKAFKKARHFRKLVWTTLVPSKKRARQHTNRGKIWKTTNLKALLSWNQLRMIEQNFCEKKTGRPKTTPANIIFLWAIQKWLNSSLSGSTCRQRKPVIWVAHKPPQHKNLQIGSDPLATSQYYCYISHQRSSWRWTLLHCCCCCCVLLIAREERKKDTGHIPSSTFQHV